MAIDGDYEAVTIITLRPDQARLDADIDAEQHAGARNVLAVLPTGGGKSVIMSERALRRHQYGVVQAIMAHRVELVGQMSLHIGRRGIPHRVIAPRSTIAQITADHRREFGRSFLNPDSICAVGAVDTIQARADQLAQWCQQVRSWKIDEAHHVLAANKWGKVAALFPNAYGEGYTASPRRADGMGLGRHHDGIFDAMVIGPTMRELIDIGALTDYEIAIPESDFHIDDDDLAPSGDWSTKRMREASKRSHIVGDVVTEYAKRALGKRAICFATDVETANEMAARFNAAGIPAASVSAKTPDDVRADYIRRFREGKFWVLVNVDLFGEGFDVPAVEVVIMARPTASLAVYLQQFGRALRVLAGKAYGLVIDHVSNWKRHGFPDKPHNWSLDRREKRGKRKPDPEEIKLTGCRECAKPYDATLPVCPHCGAAPPLPAPGGRTIEAVEGDLFLIDRERAAQMRADIELPSPADVGNRAAHVAGAAAGAGAANRQIAKHAAQGRLRDAFAQWGAIQRARGISDQQAYRKLYQALGMDLLSALHKDRTAAEYEATAQIVEGWYAR